MKRTILAGLMAAATWALLFSSVTMASQNDNVERQCKSKIRNVYGVNNFRNVWTETLGNHKFKVHGQVKFNNHKYDFNCKVKNGNVKSYAYDGPHDRHRDNDDNDNVGAAIAVGAGLAILAAAAASQADKNNGHNNSSSPQVSKSVLEDECHDMLQYRIRDEHDYTARVTLRESTLNGRRLTGDAKVKYDRGHPHHANYTCHFDSRGRLMDSEYNLY